MNRLLSAAVASLALLASPAVAQSALERGHDEMRQAALTSVELTMLLGVCEPNLSDNHVSETRASLVANLRLEPSQFDEVFVRAVQARERMPARDLALYTPLECRYRFNELVRQVNDHLAKAAKAYGEADE
jgi:hypothetical protein